MLKKIKNIIIALLGLTFVIVVHEFGHFSACKLFKVRTPVFSIGFDPAIVSQRIGSTKFQLGLLLLGGYVSINPVDLEKQSYVKKMIIMLAGILFNILLFWIIISYLSNKDESSKARLKLLLKRNNQEDTTTDEPKDFSERTKQGPVHPEASPKKKAAIIGPIGIISLMERSVELGFDVFLYYIAIISLNVAIFNLLPIPFFDGGQVLKITIEELYGKQISTNLTNLLYLIFFILLLALTIVLSIKDLKRIRKN